LMTFPESLIVKVIRHRHIRSVAVHGAFGFRDGVHEVSDFQVNQRPNAL
jgi:hypothetical protein